MKRKRKEHVDSRINRTALDLFRLGRGMLAEGFAANSVEFNEVCCGLHRALALRPWQPCIFDFELTTMNPKSYPAHAHFEAVQELHRRLAEAA